MTREEFDKQLTSKQKFIAGVARTLTPNKDRQLDLIQETNIRALKYYFNFDGENIEAWLWVVARNIYRSPKWAAKTTEPNNDSDAVLGIVVDDRNPEKYLIEKENNEEWLAQWNKILQYQRHPYWKYLWETFQYDKKKRGLDIYAVIAKKQGIPRNTAKSRIFKMKRRMIKELV